MNKTRDTDKKVEEALESLTGIAKASPGHFFFTRVQARLQRQQKNTWELISGFLARPVIAGSIVAVVIISNLIAVYREASNEKLVTTERTEISLMEDYSRQVVLFYENENAEP